MNTCWSGRPPEDSHNAHNAGQSSNQVPIGRLSRVSCAYARAFVRMCGNVSVNSGVVEIRCPSQRRRSRMVACTFIEKRCSYTSTLLPTVCRLQPTAVSDLAEALVAADPEPAQRLHVVWMLGKHQLRGCLHPGQEVRIAQQIRHAQLHETGLLGAEQLARASQLQIAPRDLETVVGLAHDGEPCARNLGERSTI